MNTKSEILIFTDGSSRGNPGPGGFGAIVVYDNTVREFGGGEAHTTNNRMELQAAIKALNEIGEVRNEIRIFTDSSYLINGITKWIYGWQKNGWQTKSKQPVENQDLWEKLLTLTSIYRSINWNYIAGHSGHSGNERCDEIATAFADGIKLRLYNGPLSQYGIDILYHQASAPRAKSTSKIGKVYSYVSQIDGVIQVHKTWNECKARVSGKSGAKFKKALSAEDESRIISEFKK